MKKTAHLVALMLTLLHSSVLSRAQSVTAPDFEALRSNWVQRLESRDLGGSLALYTTDATFTNPDGTHVSGAALRDLYQTVFQSFRAKITMTPRSHASSGSLAYEAGSYAEDITPIGDGERKHSDGDYLTVYRRTDSGGWLIVEQVWTETSPK
jgi:ketosteroid isomerase-like protein